MPENKQQTYKGFKSPPPGDLPKGKADLLAKIYSGCRRSDVEKGIPKEDKSSKQKCAKIAWSKIKQTEMKEKINALLEKVNKLKERNALDREYAGLDYEIEYVHKDDIQPGDVIEHNDALRTVGRKDIRSSEFMGTTIFGDSFRGGREKVKKVIIYRQTAKGRVRAESFNLKESYEKQVAETILQQLGGSGRLKAMIGAYNFNYSETAKDPYLDFRFKARAKNRANYIKIVLNAMDTYDVTFSVLRGYDFKEIETIDGIYADQLKEIIEDRTGLALSL